MDFLNIYPQLTVYYEDIHRGQIISQYGYCKLTWQELKAIIIKKLKKLKLNQLQQFMPSLSFKYLDQDGDFIYIINQKDFQIFQEVQRHKQSTAIYIQSHSLKYMKKQNSYKNLRRQEMQQKKNQIEQQNTNQFNVMSQFLKVGASIIKDVEQSKKQNNDKQKYKIDDQKYTYYLKCKLCKKVKIGKKFICILCQQQEAYCQQCKEKRQDPQNHPLKKIQKGSQKQIFYIRDSIILERRALQENQQSLNSVIFKKPSQLQKQQFFLLENMKVMKKSKVFQCLKNDLENEDNIIPNTMSITNNDPDNMNKLKSNINTIICIKDLDQAKDDFLQFIQSQNQFEDIKTLKIGLAHQNMLTVYSKQRWVYKNVNLALKQTQISTNAIKIAYFRYPIHQIYKQIQKHYTEEVNKKNKLYVNNFKAYHGGVITKKQFQTFQQGSILQILGFLSTSPKQNISRDFEGNFLIQIIKPENSGFVSNDGFCYLNYHQKAYYQQEQQILFNVNSKFQVLSKEQKSENGQKKYKLILKYLQLPEHITKDNYNQIRSKFQMLNDKVMANLQHLDLINRGQINQGKSLYMQYRYQDSKLFFYNKKSLLIQKIKRMRAYLLQNKNTYPKNQGAKNLQSLITSLAETFNSLGMLFKKYKNKLIHRIYTQKAQIIINHISIKYLITKATQVKLKIFLNHNSPDMLFTEINTKQDQRNQQFSNIISCLWKQGRQIFQSSIFFLDNPQKRNNLMIKKFLKVASKFDNSKLQYFPRDKSDQIMNKLLFNVIKGANWLFKDAQGEFQQGLQIKQNAIPQSSPFFLYLESFFQVEKDMKNYSQKLQQHLQIFLQQKQKYLNQISKIYNYLAIYYQHIELQEKSKYYMNENKKILTQNFHSQTYLSSQMKDTQTCLSLLKIKQLQKKIHTYKDENFKVWSYVNNADESYVQQFKLNADESYNLKSRLWGKRHPNVCKSLLFQATYYQRKQNYEKAVQLNKDILQIYQQSKMTEAQVKYYALTCLEQLHKKLQLYNQAKQYQSMIKKMSKEMSICESLEQYLKQAQQTCFHHCSALVQQLLPFRLMI